jgi:hypothetical protein
VCSGPLRECIEIPLGRTHIFACSLETRGPFHLGRYSWSINFASFLVRRFLASTNLYFYLDFFLTQFTIFICVLFILPTAHPVTSLSMNYAVVAVVGVMLLVLLMWVFWGRTRFAGPVLTGHARGHVNPHREQEILENEKEKEAVQG